MKSAEIRSKTNSRRLDGGGGQINELLNPFSIKCIFSISLLIPQNKQGEIAIFIKVSQEGQ